MAAREQGQEQEANSLHPTPVLTPTSTDAPLALHTLAHAGPESSRSASDLLNCGAALLVTYSLIDSHDGQFAGLITW